MLPEDAVSAILSHATPRDACKSSSVSSTFRSAAESDHVWLRFLPENYEDIIRRSVNPLTYSSKKDLFFRLCNPILLDSGKKSLALEKSSGRVSYTLSARELSISQSNEPDHWTWISIPGSRFSDPAELKSVGRLEIRGEIKTQILSPNTTYGAYLILKFSERAYGLDSIPSEISVRVGDHEPVKNTAYLRHPDGTKQMLEGLMYSNRIEMMRKRACEGGDGAARERGDGWMEIELGGFWRGSSKMGGDEEIVKMSLMEIKGHQLKGGLIIQGIEVRPKF